ncbi:inclusion body family protein [Xenorhabdus bovienii]|uniref:inclusion body family protein n=1 Tax=Xenorhabdus bovienii TaxID=40576 RepID=UPI00237CD3F0|nr:inclusion body family protein [Xenorhabdus bovienii]MDE1495123.1 inclusion body family protein [Xenorhabdus bovienii]MDE9473207.1 inclusion body family protein [Xenorhabdus bovienii]
MSNVIDILVAVDAQSIIQKHVRLSMNIDAPTLIGPTTPYIHMLAQPMYVKYHQGESDLAIKAKNGDLIRWRGITLSKDSEYSAALLKFRPISLDTNQFFSPPVVNTIHSYVPVLKVDGPIVNPALLDVDLQSTANYHWEIMIKNMPRPGQSATEHYTFTVGIYENGLLKGYVYWDPAIILDSTTK